jgi:hypothetical protein
VETLGTQDDGGRRPILRIDRWGGGAPPRGTLLDEFRPAFFPLPYGE